MDLNPSQIMAAIAGSALGYVYFHYGRSQSDWPLVASGLALMTYSVFVASTLGLVLIGAALAAAPFAYRRCC